MGAWLGAAARVPAGLKAAVFWAAVAAVVALSLVPVAQLPPQAFSVWDKAQHALGFVLLALLGAMAYPRHWGRLWPALLCLGVGIELAQSATGWRQGDALDWLADAVGVSVGAALCLSARRCARTGGSPAPRPRSAPCPAARAGRSSAGTRPSPPP